MNSVLDSGSASVADPDPYVFWAPGSGSGYFHHQAKIVRKTLIPTIRLFMYEISLYDVNVLMRLVI
jgi:hypothetical protein